MTKERIQFPKKKSRYMMDSVLTGILWGVAGVIVLTIAWLLYTILAKGLPILRPDFLVNLPDEILAGGGVGPFLFNSIYVLIIAMVISLPIGVGAGIYLAEYAPANRVTEFIRTCVESLASVPSIVFGLFGYVLFVDIFDIGLTILGAGIALSLLNLPVITRVTEESITSVPAELREASLAMGATKSTTIVKVVIPAALSGILTGVSLAACRAFGESAVILLAGGTGTSGVMWDFNPLSQGGTLPVHLWYVQSEALVEDAAQIADKSAAVLVLIVLLISLMMRIPIWVRDYSMRQRRKAS
ncbi:MULTISPECIES: phosphate ABC transporter permease PstA [Bacillaceae]|uniref:Phosphate transport system permease protein PstA n=1 Tax=Metabacillus sediminis TaxID=3117746 RepID=A0ABZ2NFL7_9BACI|nr:phosphate ABC transporter permease PstA [Bacillus sp. SJS]KZZ85026.1 phosphate ABC transporter, permease protein PstA [Bacillus sp. SJS]